MNGVSVFARASHKTPRHSVVASTRVRTDHRLNSNPAKAPAHKARVGQRRAPVAPVKVRPESHSTRESAQRPYRGLPSAISQSPAFASQLIYYYYEDRVKRVVRFAEQSGAVNPKVVSSIPVCGAKLSPSEPRHPNC